MTKGKLVSLSVLDLIKNTSDYLEKNFNDVEIINSVKNFALKYNKIEHFISLFNMTIYVNDINKANTEFSSKDILYIENISKLFILKLYSDMNIQIKNQFVSIIFIEDDFKHNHIEYSDIEINKSLLLFEETAINMPFYFLHSKTQYKEIEKELLFEQKYYVKNARKSVFNTLYSMTPMIPFRLNSSDRIINIDNVPNLLDKYVNIKCPYCSEKFEINIQTIASVITIENRNKRISFNCLHKESSEIKEGKFYINPLENFSIDISQYSDSKIQLWFLYNFHQIVNKELKKVPK